MYLSLFLSILNSIYSLTGIESTKLPSSLNNATANPIVITQAVKNEVKARDELVLRQKAIAQGYRLEDAQIDPQDTDRETYLYRVSIADPNTSQVDFCSPDLDGIAKAMLLSGTWDETGKHISNDNITVACTSGVLAKCVRMGYKPWKKVAGVSLQDYHQACTRMARADYCGNGISHTQDGTLIDVYDRLRIQQPDKDSNLVFEAAWGVDGAVLLNHTRYGDLERLKEECPAKLQQIYANNQSSGEIEHLKQIPSALIFNKSSQNYQL